MILEPNVAPAGSVCTVHNSMTPKLQIQGSKAPEELCLALRQDQREAGSGGSSSLTPTCLHGGLPAAGFPQKPGAHQHLSLQGRGKPRVMPQKCSSALPKPWSNSQVSHRDSSIPSQGSSHSCRQPLLTQRWNWVQGCSLGTGVLHHTTGDLLRFSRLSPTECSSLEGRLARPLCGCRPLTPQRLWPCWQLQGKKCQGCRS